MDLIWDIAVRQKNHSVKSILIYRITLNGMSNVFVCFQIGFQFHYNRVFILACLRYRMC